MPRFFAWFGFSVFGAVSAAAFLGETASLAAAALTAGMAVLLLSLRRKIDFVPVVLLSVSLAFSLYGIFYHISAEPFQNLAGKKAWIQGVVLDAPEEENQKYYYRLKITKLQRENGVWEQTGFTVRLSANQAFPCRPYDELTAEVGFYAFQGEGLYSQQNSRLAKGVVMGAYLSGKSYTVTEPERRSLWALFPMARQALKRQVGRLFPKEEAGLIQAMLLGDKSGILDGAESDFRDIGASHLLVISGIHLSAIAAFFSLLLSLFPLRRRGRNLLTAGAVVLFLALIGFPFSALRSGVMLLIFLLADCLGREADSLNSLGFALLWICVGNPFAGGDAGLALSALSTLGILKLQPGIYQLLIRPVMKWGPLLHIAKPLANSLSVSLAALLCTLPLQLLVFEGVSLLAPLSSLLLILPGTFLLYAAAFSLVLSLIPPIAPAAAPFTFAAGLLARFLLRAAEGLARLPVPFAAVSIAGGLLSLCFAGICLAVCRFGRVGLLERCGAAALCISVFAMCCAAEHWALGGGVTISVIEMGESSCVVLTQGQEAAVLSLDGYNTGAVSTLLSRENIRKVRVLRFSTDSWEAAQAAERIRRKCSIDRAVYHSSLYLDRKFGPALEGAKITVHSEPLILPLLEGITADISGDGSGLSFTAEGVKVIVETGPDAGGECDLLITNQVSSRINSPFTVLQADAIIKPALSAAPEASQDGEARYSGIKEGLTRSSAYLFAGEARVTRLRLENGQVAVRRES